MAGAIAWQEIYPGAAYGLLCLIYWPAAATAFRTLVQTHSENLIALEVSYFQISLLGMGPLMISAAIGNFSTPWAGPPRSWLPARWGSSPK
jgi:hypothetical protein